MNWAVLVAGGRGTRLGLPHNKAFEPLLGEPMLVLSLRALLNSSAFGGVTVVVGAGEISQTEALIADGAAADVPLLVVEGGNDRQASVRNGLTAMPPEVTHVAVHDAARPLVTPEVIAACLASALKFGSGVAAVPLKDTIKWVDDKGMVCETPTRSNLRAVQTPQAFCASLLKEAHECARQSGLHATDDAALVEAMGVSVRLVEGDSGNIKVTTPEDIAIAEALLAQRKPFCPSFRIGQGYDVHRLVEDRPLILCGVHIPWERGLLGHSDADVAAHALCDAVLGAAGLGDIGQHFPDTDPAYAGADSLLLLAQVVRKAAGAGYDLGNADVTIVAQRPKLKDFMPQMADNLARALGVNKSLVNVKATTTEGLGFEGRGEGISAQAVALLIKREQ
ncbi:MAG: 2-C-methyl-D-erythritol 4-phosphate cytidylyltransferase [Clostridia bacterium]|nr:2-C-methyl-D-erythritol 4-phosphate cytidylyltransferase [Clostridia bacterium]